MKNQYIDSVPCVSEPSVTQSVRFIPDTEVADLPE